MDRDRARRRLGPATGLLLAAALVASCSGGSSSNGEAAKPPNQVLADAKAATAAASSVHVAGSATSNGTPIKLDLVAAHGRGGGTVSESGATFRVILAGTKVYLRAAAADWDKLTGSSSAGQLFGDKWIQTTTANKDFADLANLVDISKLVDGFTPTGTVTKKPVTKFNGTTVLPLLDSGGNQGTLFVAATGKPVIVGVTNNSAGNAGSIVFNGYGSATAPSPPSGAINLDQLQQSTGG